MKNKTLLLFVLFVYSTVVFSQTDSGTFYIGGNTNLTFLNKEYGYESDEQDFESSGDVKSYNFEPALGYFVFKNILIGLSVPIDYSEQESSGYEDYSSTYETSSYIVAPFIRFYIDLSASKKVKLFLEGQVGRGKLNVKRSYYSYNSYYGNYEESDDSDFKLAQYKIGGGFSVFLNDKVSLDLSIMYGYDSQELDGDEDYYDSGLKYISKGFEPGVGLSVYL